MTGRYYQNASPDEVNEALRALGSNIDIRRLADTPNGQAPSGHLNLQRQRVDTTVSDPDQHAAELATIRGTQAEPDSDVANVWAMTNAERLDYHQTHGYPVPHKVAVEARTDPDGRVPISQIPAQFRPKPEPPTAA